MKIEIQEVKEKLLSWQKRGLTYTSTGYGKKISTSKMVKVNNKWYRVYCCIFSNSGTCFICKDKQEIIIDL